MAAVKRNIAEVSGSSDNTQHTSHVTPNLAFAPDAKSTSDSTGHEKAVFPTSEPNKNNASAAAVSAVDDADALDEEEFDIPFSNTDGESTMDEGTDATSKTGVDLEALPSYQGKPMTDFNINSEYKDGKPWLKTGADITDWFNYGFNEITWQRYLDKQRELRNRFGQRSTEPQRLQTIGTTPMMNNNNFLNEIGSMLPRFNRIMMPQQQPPPFVMRMMQQQQMQGFQTRQPQQMSQQQPFPVFQPNNNIVTASSAQPPVQMQQANSQRVQLPQQTSLSQQPQSFQQQMQQPQSIMVRTHQSMQPHQQMSQQRPGFNFNAARMVGGGQQHPSSFINTSNVLMLSGQTSQQGGVPAHANADPHQQQQPPPLPTGVQTSQPLGPPTGPSGPRRQLTSLTG